MLGMAGKIPLIEFLSTKDWSFEDIKSLLEEDLSSFNEPLTLHNTVLFWMLKSQNCSTDVVRLLLQNGASIDSRDVFGDTPLLCALKRRRDHTVINELIENGGSINVEDNFGNSPLCIALGDMPSKELIQSLLKAGCSVQSCTSHTNALHCFGGYGIHDIGPGVSEDIIKLLIEAGVDVTKVDNEGRSPLCYALLAGAGVSEIKLLLSNGASFRDCKMHDSPMFCVTDGDSEKILKAAVIELLLTKGASVEQANAEDCTPLQLALRYGRYETAAIRILINHAGMKNIANIKHAVFGNLLHFAVANSNCRYRIVKLLLRNGVRCDEINAQGRTPLHEIMRADYRDLRIVKLLIKSGSPVNLKCKYNYTPLCLAVEYKMEGYVLQEFLEAGAFINGLNNRDGIPLLKQVLEQTSHHGIDRFKILLKWSLIEHPNIHIKGLLEGHKYNVQLTRFAEECILDLKRMECVIVGQDLTLLDFVKGNSTLNVFGDSDPKYNFRFDELLRAMSNNQLFKFFDVISSKISKPLMMKKLQQLSVNTVKTDYPCIELITECNYECLLEITKYLTNQELLCLILTFYL